MKRYLWTVATSSLALSAIAGCVEQADAEPETVAATSQAVTAVGSALPGTDPVRFAEALENFNAVEESEGGLGPLFNERASGNCHNIPAPGGSGVQIERRFGSFENGAFYGYDQA